MMQRPPPEDFSLKETRPHLGGGKLTGDKLTSTYDLVEQMQYLYVRVVKAKELPGKDLTGSCDPYVEVKLGNYKGTTRHFEKKSNPEWNQVFAFSKDRIQASFLEATVKDKDVVKDDLIGRVVFDLNEVPKRVPPDSPLAPQWYRLEGTKGEKVRGELMLAVWFGTQADEAFPEAWHSDAATVSGTDALANIRSKVYLSPKLWYLRVNVIEAQDLIPSDKGRYPEVYVKAIVGNQALRTRVSQSRTINPMWNEDLMFVAAEPFEEPLILSVEDRVAPNKDEVLGRCAIPLQHLDRRFDHRPVNSRWFNLEKHIMVDGEKKEIKFASRIHMRICLEGGYHVLDESTHYSSDLRPTAKQLWKPSIGVLEVGILNATGLMPMKNKDGRGTTDAYCVAKYGQKWIRTRTIIDSFTPRWNEQYTWEVFDPCTVVTVGVFDNCHLHGGGEKNGGGGGGGKDSRIGKVRIRLSTLETDRVYTHSYPLLVLHPNGVKKMGEIHLAVRFTCSSLLNMMYMYSVPLLPKMHYIHPLTVSQLDNLRHQATQIVSMRLTRAEPPLRKEVVEYMLDVGSHMWSMRRSKANFFRIMGVLSGLIAVGKWFEQICNWKNPITTVLIHLLFIILVVYPELILPTIFLYLFLIGVWYYLFNTHFHLSPMANNDDDDSQPQIDSPSDEEEEEDQKSPNANSDEEPGSDSDSDSSSESSESENEGEPERETDGFNYIRPSDLPPDPNTTPETNIRRFNRVLEGKRVKRIQEEEERKYKFYEDLFDFPKDPERWKEEDLREVWADAPPEMTKPGWDPVWAEEEDWEVVNEEIQEGRDPGIQPFYVPYRKPYPAIPDNHYDIDTPKAVVEELDRIEEFLQWVSYIFPDGSSYEGTVWDDLAQGKGVYIAENGLVRYEGEWLQNDMEGHGVVEVDIPDIEPMPGSKLEEKMRAEGRIIKRDYMSPEDRKWLEMDVEDSVALTDGNYEVPYYENEEWITQFGEKPEKGRYRYAGQWKHGRMHGCGVYEVNERILYGRFYFGELLEEEHGCTVDICALHSGLAEVAAAKARMFVNKPDGMVREERGPYGDPQHAYFYEEDDVWMAPGFINQFYEVPEYWETYVEEVDQEREMWLNSFYKAPLRLPMPAELEHWWQNVEVTPEFVLLNKEPEPDPEDPSKLVQTEDPVILHTPTGRIINYVEDEKHGVRLFWQPPLEEGEDVDPSKVEFLPLGFDEFYGKEVAVKKEHPVKRFVLGIEKALKPMLDGIEKWTEEKKKENEERKEMLEKELELVEAEICLEEAIEDMDEVLKMKEQEEEKKTEMGLAEEEDEEDVVAVPVYKEEKVVVTPKEKKIQEKKKQEDEPKDDDSDDDEDDDSDDDDDDGPSSFGSVDKRRTSPFSATSLSFASCSLFPAVQSRLESSFLAWKQHRAEASKVIPGINKAVDNNASASIHFPPLSSNNARLKMGKVSNPGCVQRSSRSQSQLSSLSRLLSSSASCSSHDRSSGEDQGWLWKTPVEEMDAVLSLQVQTKCSNMFAETPALS